MKKIMMIGTLAVALAATSFAEGEKGGFKGFIHGCCFGARGAAAYNDGKKTPPLYWIDAILLGNLLAAIDGAKGKTTEDYRAQFGDSCY